MANQGWNRGAGVGSGAVRRDDLRSLLGRPWLRLLLGVTAIMSVVATAADSRRAAAAMAAQVVVAEPVRVEPSANAVTEAWRQRAVERESQRLATEYTRRGYRVSAQLAREIHDAALRYDIDPAIAFGLVRAESSFRNSATSHVGAVGLTQLMPRTAAWIEPGTSRADLRDPKKNLDVGFKYLRYLLDKYDGDTRLALLAYNRGPGTVDRVLRRGGNPDNGYVEMVLFR